MTGFPVTLSDRGIPVVPVESRAPAATVVEKGGIPVTIADRGLPLVIIGWSPSDHDFFLTSVPGGVSVEWTGEPVDFTLTPVSGGLSVEWSE